MIQWIISSCALILIVIIIRRVLWGKISLRLQYSLWSIVLLRLLLPFSFFESELSLMTAAKELRGIEIAQTVEKLGSSIVGIEEIEYVPYTAVTPTVATDIIMSDTTGSVSGYYRGDSDHSFPTTILTDVTEPEYQRLEKALKLRGVLMPIWMFGAAAMAIFFLITNLRFGSTLKRSRQKKDISGSIVPVYVSEIIPTPCLFGFFRPAVYLTPECENDLGTMRHVLAHESTHYHHGDHIWAILRCAVLAMHWYNPLVWWAAVLSKRDAELACDEGAVKWLGENERTPYGRTLIGMTCQRSDIGALAHTATTMTGSGKSIKERITLIAKKPRMAIYTLIAVLIIAIVAVVCTFSGAKGGISDGEFISMSYSDSYTTAFANGVTISEKGVLSRESDESGEYVVVRFPVIEPVEKSSEHIKVTYAMSDGKGNSTDKPYRAVVEYSGASAEVHEFGNYHDVKISAIIDHLVPVYAIEAARDYVYERAQEYEKRSVEIGKMMLTGLTCVPTEASGKDFDIEMYLVEYRLLPVDADRVNSVAYTTMEDGWITEQSYSGQPYLMLFTGENGVFSGLCMHTNTYALDNDYSTPGMLAKYGSKYTAACMESYYELIGEGNNAYYVMLSTGGVGIPPYYHLNYERVYTDDGWVIADGTAINIDELTVPTVSIGDFPGTLPGYVELELHFNPLITESELSIYDENFEALFFEGKSFYDADDLYALEPGRYYVAFDITVPGRYIAEEDLREEKGYKCIFRLEVI